MIKIGDKSFLADQVIEISRENTVPIQPVETGFDVQDHIKLNPLQVRIEVIIFDDGVSSSPPSGGTTRVFDESTGEWRQIYDGSTVDTSVDPSTGTYEHLMNLRDNRELVMVDCSNYARTAPMIYPDMAITHLGQLAQRGGIFYCSVLFTQITKTDVVSVPLYIQETTVDVDGVETYTILWSKEDLEPSSIESLARVAISENPPSCHAIAPDGQKVTSNNMLEDMWNWAAGVTTGLHGRLVTIGYGG